MALQSRPTSSDTIITTGHQNGGHVTEVNESGKGLYANNIASFNTQYN